MRDLRMIHSANALFRSLLAATFLALLLATPADAQRMQQRDRPADDVAGAFDYYTLVLSWSPTYCASQPSNDSDPQCRHNSPRPYAFVLHGLWPQYEKGYPEYCRTRERPFVPRRIIDGMLDIMPSPRLVIHEYRKHGTCSGLDPVGYYDLSRKLFDKITIPQRFIAPEQPFFVTPSELANDFLKANPGLERDMFAIECHGSGNRLRDVRICFSREGNFRSCGDNEHPRRLCRAGRMYVPPVRSGGASILPGPRGQRSL